ncbi:hypothetical protein EV356DRAFT_513651 [Viridothelium virens]|uniref:Uncharacterized protein n=1 Tax=Viridothelium virens TaxID=1048519 RepID=A0A6A6HCJ7_VIRVR|nr:hypothetical protein EV356DRAFT_513651 [Viridothelium virens]
MSDTTLAPDAKAKPFRFKRPRPDDLHDDDLPSQRHSSRSRFEIHRHSRNRKAGHHDHHSSHHRHRSKRRKPSAPSPTHFPQDDSIPDKDEAFREALFDALADDEGADYWSHIYGQPIHTYPRAEAENIYGGAVGDEEYASYVREKMWERSHQHVLEERERRARERERQRHEGERDRGEEEELRKKIEEEEIFRRKVEGSLKRRREKEEGSRWREAWERYQRKWVEAKEALEDQQKEKSIDAMAIIPWPVESGKAKHVSKDGVDVFFRNSLLSLGSSAKGATLRAERVRWHPDKIQHRFGGQAIDAATMKLVNTVFLTVDSLYDDNKSER